MVRTIEHQAPQQQVIVRRTTQERQAPPPATQIIRTTTKERPPAAQIVRTTTREHVPHEPVRHEIYEKTQEIIPSRYERHPEDFGNMSFTSTKTTSKSKGSSFGLGHNKYR